MMKSGSRELGIADRFAAGSLAGVFSQTAIYPLEVCYTLVGMYWISSSILFTIWLRLLAVKNQIMKPDNFTCSLESVSESFAAPWT